MRYSLKMIGVHTILHLAKMVNVKPFGDLTFEKTVRNPMGTFKFSRDTD